MTEVFRDIEGVTSKPMFGGWGIYLNNVFFSLIGEGQLYFKVDETNQAEYEKQGSKPFVYRGHKGKEITLTYWELPTNIMDDLDELRKWIKKSVEASGKLKKK